MSEFRKSAADKMCYEVFLSVKLGLLRTRTRLSDAAECYADIGGLDGPPTVPQWIENYERTHDENTDGNKPAAAGSGEPG